MTARQSFSILISLVFACLLGACGGGGGGDGVAPVAPDTTISGVAHDGRIANGTVTLYSFATGAKDEAAVLGQGCADDNGNYAITINAPSQPILVEITGDRCKNADNTSGGRYTEDASGVAIALKSPQVLRAVTPYTLGKSATVHVTYYTHLAAALAQYYVAQGQAASDAINNANTVIGLWLDLPILTTEPLDITNPANASTSLTDGLKYGFMTAAVSQWTLTANRTQNIADHTVYNSISFAQLAFDDLVTDGLLNGVGKNGPIPPLGTIALNAEVYRHKMAVAMLQMVQGTRNRTGLSVAAVVNPIKAFNDSTQPIFGMQEVTPLDEGGPKIPSISPAAGSTVSGEFTASATVSDIVGLTKVDFYLTFPDSVAHFPLPLDLPENLNNPRSTVNSKLYPNGANWTLHVEATNLLGHGGAAKANPLTINN
ncbi:MAG: Ig-like domain-containing protein [Gammaproteobacteria bacterium]|nr:Ig-like domain-containing protein [Gammaproteobacteria bacterium]